MKRLVVAASVLVALALVGGCSGIPATDSSSDGSASPASTPPGAASLTPDSSVTAPPSAVDPISASPTAPPMSGSIASETAAPPVADPATSTASAALDSGLPVLVIRESGGNTYGVIRPESLSSTSGGETYIDKIAWSSWTATEAHADATRELLTCVPDCAHGTVTPVPMTLTLSNPVNGAFTTLVKTANGQSDTTTLKPPFYAFSSAGPESSHLPYPAAADTAPTGGAATGVPQDSLVTPSNNISCAIISGHFHCMILKYDFALGPCDIERAPFISLEPTGPATMSPCIGDSFAGVKRTPTAYGTVVQIGQITCDVEETGVRCTNPEGQGFNLSRAAFAPF